MAKNWIETVKKWLLLSHYRRVLFSHLLVFNLCFCYIIALICLKNARSSWSFIWKSVSKTKHLVYLHQHQSSNTPSWISYRAHKPIWSSNCCTYINIFKVLHSIILNRKDRKNEYLEARIKKQVCTYNLIDEHTLISLINVEVGINVEGVQKLPNH